MFGLQRLKKKVRVDYKMIMFILRILLVAFRTASVFFGICFVTFAIMSFFGDGYFFYESHVYISESLQTKSKAPMWLWYAFAYLLCISFHVDFPKEQTESKRELEWFLH